MGSEPPFSKATPELTNTNSSLNLLAKPGVPALDDRPVWGLLLLLVLGLLLFVSLPPVFVLPLRCVVLGSTSHKWLSPEAVASIPWTSPVGASCFCSSSPPSMRASMNGTHSLKIKLLISLMSSRGSATTHCGGKEYSLVRSRTTFLMKIAGPTKETSPPQIFCFESQQQQNASRTFKCRGDHKEIFASNTLPQCAICLHCFTSLFFFIFPSEKCWLRLFDSCPTWQ